MEKIDAKALQASKNKQLLDDFLLENESFILKYTCFVLHKNVSKSDDEWSIAFLAFSQAVRSYLPEKGNFTAFAKVVIKRRLIDYLRSQSKSNCETVVNPSVMECDWEEDRSESAAEKEIYLQIVQEPDDSLKLEIESVTETFQKYGFSFFDLAACSPKAGKTKKACAKAAAYMIKNPDILREMRNTKLLPIKSIENGTGVPRKILERHRKYIIAAIEILTGDYPFLAEYMQPVREELKK